MSDAAVLQFVHLTKVPMKHGKIFALNVWISVGTLMAKSRQDTNIGYLHEMEKVGNGKNDSFLLWICDCLFVKLLN